MAQPTSGAPRWTFRLGAAAVSGFALGPLLAHFRIAPAMTGFILFDVGDVLGIAALVCGIIGVVRGRGVGAGLGLGVLVTAVFLFIAGRAGKFPAINDITTDPLNPPRFVKAGSLAENAGRNMAYPGPVFAEQQRRGYPDLAPLPLNVPAERAFERVEAAARQMPGWTIIREDAAAHAIEGTATSRLFRFKDDFVIEVRPQGEASIVHMRSKSRDGKGDIGANAARIEAFFATLRAPQS